MEEDGRGGENCYKVAIFTPLLFIIRVEFSRAPSPPPARFSTSSSGLEQKEGGEREAARNEGGGRSWRKRDGIDGRSGRCKSRAPNFNPPLRRKSWCDRVGMGQWGNLAATSVAGGNSIREFFFNLSPCEKGALVRSIV